MGAKDIAWIHLSVLIPFVLLVGFWHIRVGLSSRPLFIGCARMVLQLSVVGYALTFLFSRESWIWVVGALTVMLAAAGWIALRPLQEKSVWMWTTALISLILGCCPVLALVIGVIVQPAPWFSPRVVIPLAGMIFAQAMNGVSLALERYIAERCHGHEQAIAQRNAYRASLVPMINALYAVGVVSIPGMMTGQILSGESPFLAVKYQIMVMLMLTAATGLSSAMCLQWAVRCESICFSFGRTTASDL